MLVYKFGGASVRDAEGVRNLAAIVAQADRPLFVVVSAMGKTTNALEGVVNAMTDNRSAAATQLWANIRQYHREIVADLGVDMAAITATFAEIEELIASGTDARPSEFWYDRIVSFGEILSTQIVAEYLIHCGTACQWIDMRRMLITDSRFGEANINMEESGRRLKKATADKTIQVFVGQGFIGANRKGETTTLGREGSDYSAAVIGNLLDCQSVTIWKDVDGILNADPRIFPDTIHIPELSYTDAVELAYSGAQIIHPKTIKPLHNKTIPLYVRPFSDTSKPGSVIKESTPHPISVPIMILRRNQVLITIRPKDFSFVLEDSLAKIFGILTSLRQKVNMTQNSAVSISICVDNSKYLDEVIDTLQTDFGVAYNKNLELLTIRSYTNELYNKCTAGKTVYVSQRTRRTARVLMKCDADS